LDLFLSPWIYDENCHVDVVHPLMSAFLCLFFKLFKTFSYILYCCKEYSIASFESSFAFILQGAWSLLYEYFVCLQGIFTACIKFILSSWFAFMFYSKTKTFLIFAIILYPLSSSLLCLLSSRMFFAHLFCFLFSSLSLSLVYAPEPV
jgi:hypothetical protein